MSAPEVSVIVPAYNATDTLGDTLSGLEVQRFAGTLEVIVVDDGSSDSTASLASASAVVTRVLSLDGVGPAEARNAGATAASGERIAFLDADCRPTPGWLEAGLAALASAELVIGETRPRPDQPMGPFDRSLWVIGCSPLFESANLFVRRELFERLGGFQSWLRPRRGKELGEDVWFGWGARRSGARIEACPDALVHHAVFPRGPLGFAGERWRLRFFPAMVRRVPELREAMFHRRYFLTPRAARFDAAVLALALSRGTRRLPLAAAAIPYVQVLFHDLREPDGAVKAGGRLMADAVGFAALAWGSVSSRSLLL